jgi:hypothetical protein
VLVSGTSGRLRKGTWLRISYCVHRNSDFTGSALRRPRPSRPLHRYQWLVVEEADVTGQSNSPRSPDSTLMRFMMGMWKRLGAT